MWSERSDIDKVTRLIQDLRRRRRKTLGIDELESALGTRDARRVHDALAPAIGAGTLTPLKGAKGNGDAMFPVYEKYRITSDPVPDHDLTTLHPQLVASAYLERNPAVLHRWWDELRMLSAWLARGTYESSATLRERCWEVFGDEKAYERKGLASCVAKSSRRELKELLRAHDDSPEDLPYVVGTWEARPATIVVSENRDPYLAMREGILEGRRSLFGLPIDAVVYGRGDAVRQSHGASLCFALESMHVASEHRVLYWGDIDREGLTILAELCAEGAVEPLEPAYRAMLVTDTFGPRPSPDGRALPMPVLAGAFADDGLRMRVEDVARAGLLLPQEVLSRKALLEVMA